MALKKPKGLLAGPVPGSGRRRYAAGDRSLPQAATAAAPVITGRPVSSATRASPLPEWQSAGGKHTLVVVNPGHFHAALTLRNSHPRLNDEVFVYAEAGPEVEAFLRIVVGFNRRAENPTAWNLHVYRGSDYFNRLRSDRRGEIAVIAGRNDSKMESISRLHDDGMFVLGDKPWIIGSEALGRLRQTMQTPPLAMDIMTERHQIATRVQRALVACPDVFGSFRAGRGEPALHFRSVHHLYKIVSGDPLMRPDWFFDTAVQGEGICDVTTHLADLAQWVTGQGQPFDYERDIERLSARQWPTAVPLAIFTRITGLREFPSAVHDRVEGGALQYLCNAELSYRLRGIPVQIESLWNLAIPEGGGDTHCAIARGSIADLIVDQGPDTGYASQLTVRPVGENPGFEDALEAATASLQTEYPGLGLKRDANVYRMTIPDALRTGHEAHFSAVLDEFLSFVDRGEWPANLGRDLVAKYSLLTRARDLSRRGV
ncbi:MAG: putative oxidoreductase C-terminal domain-containing protein [Burkholderiales bacterium]